MPLNLTHLAAFHAAVEEGSIGRGADALMVSQPAVSKQIKLLEAALGVRLIEREARGIRPTDAGRVLVQYARRIFEAAEEAEYAVGDLRASKRGKLRIAASATLATYFLPELLVKFRQRFPGVSVSLEVESGAVLQRRLLEREIEVGLSEVAPAQSEIDGRIFMSERLVAIAARSNALARRRSVSLKQLCEQPFVVRETGSMTKSMVERAIAERGLSVEVAMALGSTEAIKQAVEAGVGVGIISELAARKDVQARRLVEVKVRDLLLHRPLHELRLRRRQLSAAADVFSKMIHQAGSSHR